MGSGWGARLAGRVRIVRGGVVEISKSGGVQSLLAQQGAKCASRCNSMARLSHASTRPLYDSQPKMLTNTAACRVGCANVEAYVENRIHNTLKKGCGV